MMQKSKSIKLFVRKVFISDEFDESLLPRYMTLSEVSLIPTTYP